MNDDHIPARLKDRRDQPDLVERIAGQAARDMPQPPPLSPSTLARVVMRIEERCKPARARRASWILVAASVLLGVVTVASAAHMDLVPRWLAKVVGIEKPLPAPVGPTRPARPHPMKKAEFPAPPAPEPAKASAPVAEVSPTPPVAAVSPPPAALSPRIVAPVKTEVRPRPQGTPTTRPHELAMLGSRATPPAPRPRPLAMPDSRAIPPAPRPATLALPSPPPAPAAPTAAVPTSPVPAERPAAAPSPTPLPAPPPVPRSTAAQRLKEIVHTLRIERTPRSALDLLDRHASELAVFAEEALLLRVEALLALRRQPEALRLLDGTPLANAATSAVLLITRGQLRAAADRCAEAIADFDLALARAQRPSKSALQGRAACRQKLGDEVGAQVDRDRLRRAFPGETAP